MRRGWIKQYRKEIDSAVWLKSPLYLKFWLWLKLSVDRKTGTVCRSHNQIAEAIGWEERGLFKRLNRKTIRDILLWFESNSQVTLESSTQYMTITIVNWGIYNGTKDTEVTVTGQPKVTVTGQPSINNEVQEAKEVQEKTPVSSGEDVQQVFLHYRNHIHERAQLRDTGKKKVLTRLKTFSVEQLLQAIENFADDAWWMERNSHRGVVWFFKSDEQVDQFINFRSEKKVPEKMRPRRGRQLQIVDQWDKPITDPENRLEEILWYRKDCAPELDRDPDQGQAFTLSDEIVQRAIKEVP